MEDPFEAVVNSLYDLRAFLEKAPSMFGPKDRIKKHSLPNFETVSCVKWDEDFFISGTDILRCIIFRFEAFGRVVLNRAKFEEFVFSDLRSLKTNVKVRLEEGKSELLEFLHTNGCIRTKKKQRVFYWKAVPHDQLFLDSLERELRRAVIDDANHETHRITLVVKEPALSMHYDPLMKVAPQIPKILKETPAEHVAVMHAVFGIPLARNDRQPEEDHYQTFPRTGTSSEPVLRVPDRNISPCVGQSPPIRAKSDLSGVANYPPYPHHLAPRSPGDIDARLPPPKMNLHAYENVHLPSIHDALPPHAHLELLPMLLPYHNSISNNSDGRHGDGRRIGEKNAGDGVRNTKPKTRYKHKKSHLHQQNQKEERRF